VSAPPHAPPGGYPAGDAQAGYPQPYRAAAPAVAAGQLPASMVTAIRLMYAGAAYSLVWVIGIIAISASIVKHHPVYGSGDGQALSGADVFAVLFGIMQAALWLGIARRCRRRRRGARTAGTVLFVVYTVGVFSALASGQAGLGPAKLVTVIGWLIALAAVLALWRRSSSAFFFERTSRNR
jgi:peptidoglycan/LPS O-acetylase OafA/YrhL